MIEQFTQQFRPRNDKPVVNKTPAPTEAIAVLNEARAHCLLQADDDTLMSLNEQHSMGRLVHDDALSATRASLIRGGAVERAMEALKTLFQPGDVVEIRAIGTDRSVVVLCGDLFDPKQSAALAEFIQKQYGYRNLYVGICPRKPHMAGERKAAKAEDVLCRRHLVLDLDLKDAPDVDSDWSLTLSALRALGPVLTLNSGNGFQVWLPIKEQTGDDLSKSVTHLAEALALIGSDPVADLPRVMRLPFSLNLPNEIKRARGAVVRLALTVDVINEKECAA